MTTASALPAPPPVPHSMDPTPEPAGATGERSLAARHDVRGFPPAARDGSMWQRDSGSALCVLVVDDHESLADALAELIRLELGCEVHTAYGGAEAVDKASRVRPDVIVMDLQMPFVTGLEAGDIVARLFGDRRPSLIALTGLGEAEARAQSAQSGFMHHLTKPVDVNRLVSLITARD